MSTLSGTSSALPDAVGTCRPAEIDRRFYAFAVDRLLTWGIDAAVAVVVARTLLTGGRLLVGVLVIISTVLVVGLVSALLQGSTGRTPGKALTGLCLLDTGTERPIGARRSVLRALVLGLATVPFGLGLAVLACTALTDRSRLRRGWHDRLVSSIVVDVRLEPVAETTPGPGPRHVVNLTAMRLAPAGRAVGAVGPPTTRVRPGRDAVPGARMPSAAPADTAAAAWEVGFDTGERVLVDTLLLIGRRPEPRLGEQGARLVGLPSGDLSLSKTHVEVVVAADGALVVTDRRSTNGSTVVRQGVPRRLVPGRPTTLLAGDVVLLGDRSMQAVRLTGR